MRRIGRFASVNYLLAKVAGFSEYYYAHNPLGVGKDGYYFLRPWNAFAKLGDYVLDRLEKGDIQAVASVMAAIEELLVHGDDLVDNIIGTEFFEGVVGPVIIASREEGKPYDKMVQDVIGPVTKHEWDGWARLYANMGMHLTVPDTTCRSGHIPIVRATPLRA